MSSDVTVDLYVRSLVADGAQAQQEAVIGRLDRLRDRGDIAGFAVDVWGARVSPDGATARTDAGAAVLRQVEAFRAWADRHGMSVGFEAGETRSAITDEAYTAVVLPTMTLAEYRGDTLRFVAPCTDGESRHTVTDRLDRLERGEAEVAHGGG